MIELFIKLIYVGLVVVVRIEGFVCVIGFLLSKLNWLFVIVID